MLPLDEEKIIGEDSAIYSISMSASDNDILVDGEVLSYYASSSDESLVTVSVTTTGTGEVADLHIDLVEHQNGTANISVTVIDSNGLTDLTSFELTVTSNNDSPVFTLSATDSEMIIDEDEPIYEIALSVIDVDILTSNKY